MRGLLSPLIKLVIFLVVTSFATYVLAVTIANTGFGSTYSYRAYFTDASGLTSGDDIRIAGVRVGTVSDIKVVKLTDPNQCVSPDVTPSTQTVSSGKPEVCFVAQVSFTVQKSRSLPTSVIAQLRYRNLVGQRYIDIEQGPGDPNATLRPGSLIPLQQTHPAVDLTTLFAGFGPLLQGLDADQINQLSGELISTLQGEGGSLDSLLATLGDLTNSIADKDQVIGQVVDNLASVLTAVGTRDAELSNLIVQLQGFVSGLSGDRVTIGNAIGSINNLATSTAGLLTQVRAPLAKDITDLTGLVGNLNQGSGQIQYILDNLAPTLGALIRTASYGSWFNFYLCSVSGTITLPGGVQTLHIPLKQSPQPRCN